jgi:hypothetical protein
MTAPVIDAEAVATSPLVVKARLPMLVFEDVHLVDEVRSCVVPSVKLP